MEGRRLSPSASLLRAPYGANNPFLICLPNSFRYECGAARRFLDDFTQLHYLDRWTNFNACLNFFWMKTKVDGMQLEPDMDENRHTGLLRLGPMSLPSRCKSCCFLLEMWSAVHISPLMIYFQPPEGNQIVLVWDGSPTDFNSSVSYRCESDDTYFE